VNLATPLALADRRAPTRVLFGPHETNLGDRRSLSARHVAYYRRRAAGGAGLVVTEEASVHPSDWPYERCPLASACGPGWTAVAEAVHGHGALALAAIGHAGGQGSSAYSQAPLWAPSRVPEVNSREVPKWMEPEDVDAVVAGFGEAAGLAADAGLDGVEVNAGQYSLIRQFLSGLTNLRGDAWGADRLLFARQVLEAVRAGAGPGRVVGLRLSCDELAPWAGITADAGASVAATLAPLVDYLVVVRGSIFTASATRPDLHEPPGFNVALCHSVRAAVRGAGLDVPVFLQGSVVEVGQAEWALGAGVCDGVEMTRAQIADPDLVAKATAGDAEGIRPCLLCNQACQVRDARNPIVSCVVEPTAGHETEDPPIEGTTPRRRPLVVVGGGPAGLEAARVAASRGHAVRVLERSDRLGGSLAVAAAANGRTRLSTFVDWLVAECRRLGVSLETASAVTAADVARVEDEGAAVLLCTGSVAGARSYDLGQGAHVVVHTAWSCLSALADGGDPLPGVPDGPVVVLDPVGGPIGVSLAETLAARGRPVHLVTQDHIAGNELARTGDLAPANVRLQQAGVLIERRTLVRSVSTTGVDVEDRFSGAHRTIPAVAVVDAGHRLPDEALWEETGRRVPRAGDAVAPRTAYEAVLEARRSVLAIESGGPARPLAGIGRAVAGGRSVAP